MTPVPTIRVHILRNCFVSKYKLLSQFECTTVGTGDTGGPLVILIFVIFIRSLFLFFVAQYLIGKNRSIQQNIRLYIKSIGNL